MLKNIGILIVLFVFLIGCSQEHTNSSDTETAMDDIQLENDGPMSEAQVAIVSKLTVSELEKIDKEILKNSSHQWRKVARVVGQTLLKLQTEFPGVPDVFYSARIEFLVKSGALQSQGNLKKMRYSEIKLP